MTRGRVPSFDLALLSLCLLGSLACDASVGNRPPPTRLPSGTDWQTVRSVSNPLGGTVDLVLIPKKAQRDRGYCREVGEAVCGTRHTCLVNFWVDRSKIPESADMPVGQLQALIATYERHPNYTEPHLRFACWLYSEKPVGVGENCFVMPGTKVPWEAP